MDKVMHGCWGLRPLSKDFAAQGLPSAEEGGSKGRGRVESRKMGGRQGIFKCVCDNLQ